MVNCKGSPLTQIIKNNFPLIIVDKLRKQFFSIRNKLYKNMEGIVTIKFLNNIFEFKCKDF